MKKTTYLFCVALSVYSSLAFSQTQESDDARYNDATLRSLQNQPAFKNLVTFRNSFTIEPWGKAATFQNGAQVSTVDESKPSCSIFLKTDQPGGAAINRDALPVTFAIKKISGTKSDATLWIAGAENINYIVCYSEIVSISYSREYEGNIAVLRPPTYADFKAAFGSTVTLGFYHYDPEVINP